MESNNKHQLILEWEICDSNKGEYIVKIYTNDKFLSKIDFKNDKDFKNIDIINDYIIENINKYSSLKIVLKEGDTEDVLSSNEIWKDIFEKMTELWITEFDQVKNEFNNIKIFNS